MAEKNMRCAFWREGDRCAKFSDDECDSFCVLGPCSAQVPSNADKIRTMNDGDMAKFLYDRSDEYFFPMWTSPEFCVTTTSEILNTEQAWLQWLQSPADGGDSK